MSVPLQLSHPDRGLAELPPPNDGDQSRPSGVYTRPTSKHDRVSNLVNRVGTETAARDLSSEHPLSDGGPVTANYHFQPSSASTGPNGTVPPSAVLSGGEPLPEKPHLLEDEFHLRRSTRKLRVTRYLRC